MKKLLLVTLIVPVILNAVGSRKFTIQNSTPYDLRLTLKPVTTVNVNNPGDVSKSDSHPFMSIKHNSRKLVKLQDKQWDTSAFPDYNGPQFYIDKVSKAKSFSLRVDSSPYTKISQELPFAGEPEESFVSEKNASDYESSSGYTPTTSENISDKAPSSSNWLPIENGRVYRVSVKNNILVVNKIG